MLRRAEIRQDVMARLTGNTNAGANVFSSKATPLEAPDMPAIMVYVTTNLAEQQNPEQAPERLFFSNELSLILDVHATGETDDQLDDALDGIVEQIETTLLTAMDWVRQFPIIGPIEADTTYETEGGSRRGVTTLTIALSYATSFPLLTP